MSIPVLSSEIGWHGLTLWTPERWDIGAIGGDKDAGYLRVDDSVSPRLEVKWSKPTGKVDLHKTLTTYLEGLRRRTRQKKAQLTAETDLRLVSKRRKRKEELISFRWRPQAEGSETPGVAYGIIWHCGTCGRVLIAQLLGTRDQETRVLAERIFARMEDHPQGDWERWRVYDFAFEVPRAARLETHRLVTGQLALTFRLGKEQELRVERWAMSNLLLRDTDFKSWAGRRARERNRQVKVMGIEALCHGHPGVQFNGRLKPVAKRLRECALHVALRRQPLQFVGYAWHCEPSNKCYVVEGLVYPSDRPIVGDIMDSVGCHGTDSKARHGQEKTGYD